MWAPKTRRFAGGPPFVTPYHRNRGQGTAASYQPRQSGWSHADLILNVQGLEVSKPLSLPHRMCEPLRLSPPRI